MDAPVDEAGRGRGGGTEAGTGVGVSGSGTGAVAAGGVWSDLAMVGGSADMGDASSEGAQ
jgi:hypothetical protein